MTLSQRLYKDPQQGMILGVCAGLAAYFQVEVTFIRLVFMLPFPPIGFTYLLLALLLEPKPQQNPGAEWFLEPLTAQLNALQARLAQSEQDIIRLEAFITSDEFEFQRKLWELDP